MYNDRIAIKLDLYNNNKCQRFKNSDKIVFRFKHSHIIRIYNIGKHTFATQIRNYRLAITDEIFTLKLVIRMALIRLSKCVPMSENVFIRHVKYLQTMHWNYLRNFL